MPVSADAVAAKGIADLVVVAPDAGYAKKARQRADRLKRPLASLRSGGWTTASS
jgi:ribose-phosphate pyrophosphokinase